MNEQIPCQLFEIDQLRAFEWHDDIYDSHPDAPLVEDIRKNGILEPLLITLQNEAIIGAKRLEAAKMLGINPIPTRHMPLYGISSVWSFLDREIIGPGKPRWFDKAAFITAMIDSNIQRKKTPEEVARETGWKFMLNHLLDQEQKRLAKNTCDFKLAAGVSLIRTQAIIDLRVHPKFATILKTEGEDRAFAYALKQGWISQLPPKSARIVYDY